MLPFKTQPDLWEECGRVSELTCVMQNNTFAMHDVSVCVEGTRHEKYHPRS